MANETTKWWTGILTTLVLGAAAAMRTVGDNGAAFLLETSHSASALSSNLDEIAKGSYAKSQAVDLFCSASASLAQNQKLPDELTNWNEFSRARLGIGTKADEYFDGKAEQLTTAFDIARRSPQAAAKYAKACLMR